MTDFLANANSSQAFQILCLVSGGAAALYEAYVRSVTRRTTRGPVLGAELEAFFAQLQRKWRGQKAAG